MTGDELFIALKEKGYGGEKDITDITEWLRIFHYIIITPVWESLGSDEWCYGFEVRWLPKEFHEAKRRCPHFQTKQSFSISGGASYSGGWDTPLEAIEEGVKYSLKLL